MKDLFEYKELKEFTEALDSLESAPPPEVWNRLETRLNSTNNQSSNPFYGGLITIAFLGLLTLMEGSVFYLFQQQIPRNISLIDHFITDQSVKEEISFIPEFKPIHNIYLEKVPAANLNSHISITDIEAPSVPFMVIAPFSPKPVVSDSSEEVIASDSAESLKKNFSIAPKKKKKFRGFQLPSLRRKPWQRGSDWDYQVGVEGGLVSWRVFDNYREPGNKLSLHGELVFSPYFRLSLGSSLIRLNSPILSRTFADDQEKLDYITYNQIQVDPDLVMPDYQIKRESTFIDIPVLLKVYLPLKKQRFAPYAGIGVSTEILNKSWEAISLELTENRFYVAGRGSNSRIDNARLKLLMKAGTEIKLNKRLNLQVGVGYQRESQAAHTLHLETSLWFTGNRGYFRWRRE
ncbi:MAG: hypothetical protein KDE26_15605 [Bacteroidetes bacterium]|nr:hypothetical protein [Bacteroidota bacterium]